MQLGKIAVSKLLLMCECEYVLQWSGILSREFPVHQGVGSRIIKMLRGHKHGWVTDFDAVVPNPVPGGAPCQNVFFPSHTAFNLQY